MRGIVPRYSLRIVHVVRVIVNNLVHFIAFRQNFRSFGSDAGADSGCMSLVRLVQGATKMQQQLESMSMVLRLSTQHLTGFQ